MKLTIQDVGKRYKGDFWGLRSFTLELEPGVLGLLGPNGAGKSTLMRILATITKPTEGQVLWNGTDAVRSPDGLRAVLGYLPQDFGVYPNLNAVEFLEYMAAVKGLDAGAARRRIDELLALVNLTEARKRPLGGYSGGMKQRIGIAQALLNDPQLLIVDEPTVGLDPGGAGALPQPAFGPGRRAHRHPFHPHRLGRGGYGRSYRPRSTSGRLLAYAEPEELLRRVEGRVWEWVLPSAELRAARERWRISSAIRRADGVHARVVSESPPAGAVPVPPSLEDAYLAVLEGDRARKEAGGMSGARVFWHLLRADFLERVRRYSFLVTLALAALLGYTVATGKMKLWVGDFRGVYNSAWVGILMALVTNTFLSLAGLLRGEGLCGARPADRRGPDPGHHSHVQALYTLGKTASNLAVLLAMVAVLAVMSVGAQLVAGEETRIEVWPLLSPFLFLVLPAMALTAARRRAVRDGAGPQGRLRKRGLVLHLHDGHAVSRQGPARSLRPGSGLSGAVQGLRGHEQQLRPGRRHP